MLRKFQEEKELITSWIEEGKRQLAECESEETVEITEVCDEQEELQWRKKHRENVRRHYQQVAREKKKQNSSEVPLPSSTVDQDLMERLEMLELEEELHEYEAKQNQGLNKGIIFFTICQCGIDSVPPHNGRNVAPNHRFS